MKSAVSVLEEDIKAAFGMFDRVGDGTIGYRDFGTLMRSLGFNMKEEEAIQTAEKLAGENEDVLPFSAFRDFFYNKLNSKQMQEDFKLAFRAIDTDNDNLISFTDLRNFLELANEKRSEEQIKEMISDADIDGDGLINLEEFIRLMATR